MLVREFAIWLGWILWIGLLNGAALFMYYSEPTIPDTITPRQENPVVSFQGVAKIWQPENGDITVLIESDQKPTADLKVSCNVSGDLVGLKDKIQERKLTIPKDGSSAKLSFGMAELMPSEKERQVVIKLISDKDSAYQLGTFTEYRITVPARKVIQVAEIKCNSSEILNTAGECEIIVKLKQPAPRGGLELPVHVEGTATAVAKFRHANAIQFKENDIVGKLGVTWMPIRKLDPEGRSLDIVFTSKGDLELSNGAGQEMKKFPFLDGNARGEVAVFLILTKEARDHQRAIVGEMRKLLQSKDAKSVIGNRLFLIDQKANIIDWDAVTDKAVLEAPSSLDYFHDQTPINDFFAQTMKALESFRRQLAKDKTFATYLIYPSATDPDLATKKFGGEGAAGFELPKDGQGRTAEIYVAWLAGPDNFLYNNLIREPNPWLKKHFGGERGPRRDRVLNLDHIEQNLAADIQAVIGARK